MTTKADYTPEEWTLLKESPAMVGLAVIAADPSGPVGVFRELYSVGKSVIQTQQAATTNALVTALVNEIVEERGQELHPDREELKGKDLTQLRGAALDACRHVADLLDHKATPEEAAGFKAWLLDIAKRVTEAASEGGFLGFGGTRVSEAEAQALREISGALRVSA